MEEKQEPVTAYRLAKMMKIRPESVLRSIRNGELPATKKDGHWSIEYRFASIYARDYKPTATYKMPIHYRKKFSNNTEVCSSCGIRNTNLVGDIRNGIKYGYLCSKCQKLLQASNYDIERVEKFFGYMKKTK